MVFTTFFCERRRKSTKTKQNNYFVIFRIVLVQLWFQLGVSVDKATSYSVVVVVERKYLNLKYTTFVLCCTVFFPISNKKQSSDSAASSGSFHCLPVVLYCYIYNISPFSVHLYNFPTIHYTQLFSTYPQGIGSTDPT